MDGSTCAGNHPYFTHMEEEHCVVFTLCVSVYDHCPLAVNTSLVCHVFTHMTHEKPDCSSVWSSHNRFLFLLWSFGKPSVSLQPLRDKQKTLKTDTEQQRASQHREFVWQGCAGWYKGSLSLQMWAFQTQVWCPLSMRVSSRWGYQWESFGQTKEGTSSAGRFTSAGATLPFFPWSRALPPSVPVSSSSSVRIPVSHPTPSHLSLLFFTPDCFIWSCKTFRKSNASCVDLSATKHSSSQKPCPLSVHLKTRTHMNL